MGYTKIPLQDLRLDKRYENLKKISGKEFSKIEKFIAKSKNGEGRSKVDITDQTERKYVDVFVMAYKNINKKQISQLTKEDLTNLKQDLKSGKIKSRFDKPYTPASQRDMQTILIRFLEFLNPKKYAGYREWFIIRPPRKSVEFLKEEEVLKLFKTCKSNEERYLIAVLFDGGLRASEFLNIRFEDIQEPTQAFPYYKIDLKEEYSKTKGRNIGFYWKHSTDAIRDYLNDVSGEPNEQVYKKNYDAVRVFLARLGRKVLNKRIHFHMFRKSSATYYAPIIKNRHQLCYRYGWAFSSSVPDVYINRELGEELVQEDVKQTNMQKLERENQEIKTKFNVLYERQQHTEELLDKFKEYMKVSIPTLEVIRAKKKLVH